MAKNFTNVFEEDSSQYSLVYSAFLSLSVLLLAFISTCSKQKHNYPVGPMGLPIIGHLLQLGKQPNITFMNWASKYGSVFRIQMGSRFTVVINGHKAVRQALVNQSEDFAARPDFHSFSLLAGGRSMSFGSYGSNWKFHKNLGRIALSIFTQRRKAQLESHIIDEADKLVEELTSRVQPVDPHYSMHVATTSIVYSICFDEGLNIREDKLFLDLLTNMKEFSKLTSPGANPADLFPWAEPLVTSKIKRFIEVSSSYGNVLKLIQKRLKETWIPNQSRNMSDALFDACANLGPEKLSEINLTEELVESLVSDVVGAGQSTVVTVLSWSLLYLVKFDGIQKTVHEEIDRELGDGILPTYEDRFRLPYCEAVILETMRFCTSLPFLAPHATTRDCQLFGYDIPKGALVMCNMWSVSRDASIWENPDEFDPTRFIDPETNQIDRCKSELCAAFGLGKRRCLGEFLGRMETFIFFVRLMQRCKMSKVDGQEYPLTGKVGIAIEPKPYQVKIELR